MNNTSRPSGMSQLDYLWINYGNYKVQNTPSSIPQDNVILTEKALTNFINASPGISSLQLRDHPTNQDMYELIGYANDGSVLTSVQIPKVVSIESFTYRTITQEDIEQDSPYPLDSPVLSLVLSTGEEFVVDLRKIILTPSTTNTIETKIDNNVISSNLKIDSSNNYLSPVQLKTSTNGIYADIKLSSTTNAGVQIIKEGDQLAGRIPIGNTGKYLKVDSITYEQYQLLQTPDPSTLYIITNQPYIYFNGNKYGSIGGISLEQVIDEVDKAGFSIEIRESFLDLKNRNNEIISSVSLDEFNQSLNWISV